MILEPTLIEVAPQLVGGVAARGRGRHEGERLVVVLLHPGLKFSCHTSEYGGARLAISGVSSGFVPPLLSEGMGCFVHTSMRGWSMVSHRVQAREMPVLTPA